MNKLLKKMSWIDKTGNIDKREIAVDIIMISVVVLASFFLVRSQGYI